MEMHLKLQILSFATVLRWWEWEDGILEEEVTLDLEEFKMVRMHNILSFITGSDKNSSVSVMAEDIQSPMVGCIKRSNKFFIKIN